MVLRTMSRLEVNFSRLLHEAQNIANGNKPKDWTFQKDNRNLLVLYGSQTGTAQEVAERISRESIRYYFSPRVSALNDISIDELKSKHLVVFVVATSGQGDDPDNMKVFFNSLWNCRSDRRCLRNLYYGVLGLGDSSYLKFNYSAKRLSKLLSVVGGKPIMSIGLADDQHELGPDFIIDKWINELWMILLQMDSYKLPEGIVPLGKCLLGPKFIAEFDMNFTAKNISINADNISFSKITLNERKTSLSHFQDVRLIEFDTTSLHYSHKPGDVLIIQPQNLDEHVDEFIKVLGLDAEKKFVLKPNDVGAKLPEPLLLPQPCNIRQCVKSYFDILSIPKRYLFEVLSYYTEDPDIKEKFLEFASSEGQQEYYNYCTRARRSVLEVFADFPQSSKNIPFDYLFDIIPAIRPREYSIASSSIALPSKTQILMAVINYRTILKRPRLGLCSNWLAHLPIGYEVPLWIKPGTLKFPASGDSDTPVIMIGPGTGCSPFRAYIQERSIEINHPKLVMIFGCRGKDKDYFFRTEWEKIDEEGRLELYCAFSRDQEHKIYVQHVMKQNYLTLWNYIGRQGAKIYYAGNAKRIPIDVYEALQYICEKGSGMSSKEAEQYMKNIIEKRYQVESWA